MSAIPKRLIITLGLTALGWASGLPGDIYVNPAKMKEWESACVFPMHYTAEGSLWISRDAVYRRADHEPCILIILRTSGGWLVHAEGITIRRQKSHDRDLRGYGWLRLGSAVDVLR